MLIALPVEIFTGIFKLIFPATSLLFILTIPCPVKITLLIFCFSPWFVKSLFIIENISSILASIISINSELFIILLLFVSLQVFNIISLSLSMNDFNARPYCLFNLSASSSVIFKTTAISFVILSPPTGIEFVYKNDEPSNTPKSVFPAPISPG